VLRLGCSGCLTTLCLVALIGGGGWAVFEAIRAPEIVAAPFSAADGVRAQQKIFDLVRRAGSGRPHTATLSERELNAFLSRHVTEVTELPLRQLAVGLPSDGRAQVAGQLALREILGEPPFSALARLLPSSWLDRPMWLSFLARVTLEARDGGGGSERRRLRLDVERFWLGRLRLPEVMLRILLDPDALRFLRWPMPEAIDGLRIEPGRLVIQAAS
jgi:hypothetical protein